MRRLKTLGSRPGHVYVTRAATLEYQRITGAQFETARRALTEHLISAVPDPRKRGAYIVQVKGDAHLQLRAFVRQEGDLLTVPKLEQLRTPLREDTPAAYTARSPLRRPTDPSLMVNGDAEPRDARGSNRARLSEAGKEE